MNWQPIETAPKDGTEILTWDGRAIWLSTYYRGLWMTELPQINEWEEVFPTHWMPLPEPPKQENPDA